MTNVTLTVPAGVPIILNLLRAVRTGWLERSTAGPELRSAVGGEGRLGHLLGGETEEAS